jgi:hypothetical protein
VEQYLATQTGKIPLLGFLINLLLTAALCLVLSRIYQAFGGSHSNRRAFARNFVMLGMTTMVIITVVKSSLALSLGLVGALSIVRFRAAIKEPEELTYLFFVIAVGLGMGADQRWITLIAFGVIAAVIALRRVRERSDDSRHLHFSVSTDSPDGLSLSDIVRVLEQHSTDLKLSRFDERADLLDASFTIDFPAFEALEAASRALRQLNPGIKVTFLNYEGLGD